MERVTERLQRATGALNDAGVPYAVVGGNAVAAWVASIDPAAVRTTQDVDILFRASDLDAAEAALAGAGFVRRHAAGTDFFQDGRGTSVRDAVRVVIAGRKVRPEYALAAPDVTESEYRDDARVIALIALLRMKLTSFRDKDRTHVRDMLDVGLIDAPWKARLPAELADLLQSLIDTPEGGTAVVTQRTARHNSSRCLRLARPGTNRSRSWPRKRHRRCAFGSATSFTSTSCSPPPSSSS